MRIFQLRYFFKLNGLARKIIFFGVIITAFGSLTQAQSIVHTATIPQITQNTNSNVNASGDGYAAIPFQDRHYFINHHKRGQASETPFGCAEKVVGSGACVGFATAQAAAGLYKRALPDGDPNALTSGGQYYSSSASANEEHTIINNQFLIYPVTRRELNYFQNLPIDWGLGCFDLINNLECGYQVVSQNPNARQFTAAGEGPFRIDDRLYMLDLDMVLHCVKITNATTGTLGSCAGSSAIDLFSDPNFGMPRFLTDEDAQAGHIGGEVVGNRLYLSVSYHGALETPAGSNVSIGKVVVCIETTPASMGQCGSGWAGPATFASRERVDNFSNYLAFDASMAPQSICNRNTATQSCISLVTGQNTSSAHIDVAASASLRLGLGKEVTLDTKSYFPSWASDEIHCFDWAINSACANSPYGSQGLVGSNPEDYALSVDDARCVWALGDKNKLWSLDPITATSPCTVNRHVGVAAKTCSAGTWMNVAVSNLVVTEYESYILHVTDANGTVVDFDLLSISNVDLSQFGGQANLSYSTSASLANGVTQSSAPNVEMNFAADQTPCDVVVVDPCEEDKWRAYTVKLICGYADNERDNKFDGFALVTGKYSTIVNLKNQSQCHGKVKKSVFLAIPDGYQKPGEIIELEGHEIEPERAFAVDCRDVMSQSDRLYDHVIGSRQFFEGFLEVVSNRPLDVSAVYTSTDLESRYAPNIDVENAIHEHSRD